MWYLVLILFLGVYFFVAGLTFGSMMQETRTDGIWPAVGAIILSIFWVPFLFWCILNNYSETTRILYIKLAKTIFDEPNKKQKRGYRYY